MTKILTPQIKEESSELPAQVMEDEVIFKEEHKAIYDAFIQSLENKVQSEELKEGDRVVIAFMLSQNQTIFKNVNPEDIRPLSEENFCQFLLSVFKEIREQGLAGEEKLNNDKIQQIVTKCVTDIRGTEAKDSLIKLPGWPLGVKVDPKNFFSSFKDGLLEKVPFLGKDKKEEDEPPLSDEEMVKTFLRKIFLPVLFSIASISIFGPTTLAVVAAAIGAIFAIKGGVGVLFSNDKKGTLYNPSSQDKDDTEKRAKLNGKILEGIDDILKTPVEITPEKTCEERKEQSAPEQAPQVENKGSEQLTMLDGQITIDQLSKTQDSSHKP